MTTWYESYLCHYGIPGMKWGHRKMAKYYTKQANKQKTAARELREAAATQRRLGNKKGADVLRGGVEISRQKQARYQEKASRHAAAGRVTPRTRTTTPKNLEDWTIRDRYNPNNLTKSMSIKDMARAGYFGMAGRAAVKRSRKRRG